jgi:2-oxoglutarate dehydrogenase E1 component
MTPKSMLRLKAAASPLDEFVHGRFREVLDDAGADPARVRRVVLCSGKLYWELLDRRNAAKAEDTAIVRVEQFYPLNEELVRSVLGRFRKAREWVWAQEESQNNGGWWFMEPRLRAMGFAVEYVGRDASASPATGSLQIHKREQKELIEAAIGGPVPHLVRARRETATPPPDGGGSREPARPREERATKPAKT